MLYRGHKNRTLDRTTMLDFLRFYVVVIVLKALFPLLFISMVD